MGVNSAINLGARQILQRCLGLNPGQDLVIFVDETTIEVGSVIAETADLLRIPATAIFIPTSQQRRIPKETDLNLLTQGVAKDARAILTCVSAAPDCLPFRERILETQWSARTRIGHMPGANLELLTLANIDMDQLIANCHKLELAMARGQHLKFISYALDGTPHQLGVEIGGWERLPVSSDGIITDGVWGNVPSGETYIAPIEGSGEGSVVVNGSIPGYIVGPGEEIVLYFRRGRLVQIVPEDNPVAFHLNDTQIRPAREKGDENWNNLAEIGIGVNPAVMKLTGNMIYDEKAAGTAHIALGSNTFMGGNIDAAIHCDMVVKEPTIFIDDKIILERGALRFTEAEWFENYAAISLETSPICTAAWVACSGTQTTSSDHRLQRILRPEPGRVSTFYVGDEETSQLADSLYSQLLAKGGWSEVDQLVVDTGWTDDTVRRLLQVIWNFGLLHIR